MVKLIFFVYLPMKLINEPNFKYSITATRFTTYYTFIYIRIKNYGSIRAFIFRMTGKFRWSLIRGVCSDVLDKMKEKIVLKWLTLNKCRYFRFSRYVHSSIQIYPCLVHLPVGQIHQIEWTDKIRSIDQTWSIQFHFYTWAQHPDPIGISCSNFTNIFLQFEPYMALSNCFV